MEYLIQTLSEVIDKLLIAKGYAIGREALEQTQKKNEFKLPSKNTNVMTIKFRELVNNNIITNLNSSESRAQIPDFKSIKGEEENKVPVSRIYKRKDGRWEGKYYKNGKRRSVYDKTQKGCMAKLKELMAEMDATQVNSSDIGAISNKAMTFGSWWKFWYETYKVPKNKTSSLMLLGRYYRYHIEKKLSSVKIQTLKGIQVQQVLNIIESESSRKKCYEMLCDCIRTAYKNGIIKSNIMDSVELIVKKHKSTKRSITFEEEKQLEVAFKDYWLYELVMIALHSGLRKGEALALTWDDIDFEKNTITINKAFDRYSVKITTPKSETSSRIVPLFPKLKKILLEMERSPNTNELFYKFSKANAGELFKKRLRQFNLPDDITLHVLRHTFATRLMEAGIADKQRQIWLGHSSVEITNKIYTHVNDYFENESVAKASKYLDKMDGDDNFDDNF